MLMNAAPAAMIIGYLAGSLAIGALLGLIPFFLGRKRGEEGLGTAGLICCTIGNMFITGLGLFISIIFAVIILVKSR